MPPQAAEFGEAFEILLCRLAQLQILQFFDQKKSSHEGGPYIRVPPFGCRLLVVQPSLRKIEDGVNVQKLSVISERDFRMWDRN
jgi:hypothetical protein